MGGGDREARRNVSGVWSASFGTLLDGIRYQDIKYQVSWMLMRVKKGKENERKVLCKGAVNFYRVWMMLAPESRPFCDFFVHMNKRCG